MYIKVVCLVAILALALEIVIADRTKNQKLNWISTEGKFQGRGSPHGLLSSNDLQLSKVLASSDSKYALNLTPSEIGNKDADYANDKVNNNANINVDDGGNNNSNNDDKDDANHQSGQENDDKKDSTPPEKYDNYLPDEEEAKALNLMCTPGRTYLQVIENPTNRDKMSDKVDADTDDDTRRTHMNAIKTDTETCNVCVCSISGKKKYCTKRPARNVNECIRMSQIVEEFKEGKPFDLDRNLAYRIRRDYNWHRDELPYYSDARCTRGISYYTNSLNASNTDIDVESDINSLIDYNNPNVCKFCVCSINGRFIDCIPRDVWYCEYYRYLRSPLATRDMYRQLFKQDRPTYFSQLSHRLRRTMEEGLFDLLENVGVDVDQDKLSCVPFVSEYTDCTERNLCSGCQACSCTRNGSWSCRTVQECNTEEVDNSDIDEALNLLTYELKRNKNPLDDEMSSPSPSNNDDLLGEVYDAEIRNVLTRNKRDVAPHKHSNDTIKFYHTNDDLNEDTLKKSNDSGSLAAPKVNTLRLPKLTRRTGLSNSNFSDISPLRINYNQPNAQKHEIADNKIDTQGHTAKKLGQVGEEKLRFLTGNHSQSVKDKELSKLVVNELKTGSEVIGDRSVPVSVSNITFKAENDTLTAMAFIAGNLLNKLWDMEKDINDDSVDTETIKQEKIENLLDLFKDPLSLRQEAFLRNALEKLSDVIQKNKEVENVTLCENVAKMSYRTKDESSLESTEDNYKQKKEKITTTSKSSNKNSINPKALSKLNSVLDLVKKYESMQENLKKLQSEIKKIGQPKLRSTNLNVLPTNINLTSEENSSIDVFGKVVQKMIKLLMPDKKGHKIANFIKNQNIYTNVQAIPNKYKELFGIKNNKLSAKDRLLMDYLSRTKQNPSCVQSSYLPQSKKSMNIDGDTLRNLSEYLKIKSFTDLLNLLQPTRKSIQAKIEKTIEKTTEVSIKPEVTTQETTGVNVKLAASKEKLKGHLKAIINDLTELQSDKDIFKSNLNIAKILPCMYNIMNLEKIKPDVITKAKSPKLDNIEEVLEALKDEMKLPEHTRRNLETSNMTKTAAVWNRIIQNIKHQFKQARRSLNSKQPLNAERIEKLIEEVTSGSSTYKNNAFLGVIPAKRIMFLKTIEGDVIRNIKLLETIQNNIDHLLASDKSNEIKEYVYNAAAMMKLNEKVVTSLGKSKTSIFDDDTSFGNGLLKQKTETFIPNKRNYRISREQIGTQLIKNRLKFYLRMRESKSVDFKTDSNYNLAKLILTKIEEGNYAIAKQLFNIFVTRKSDTKEAPINSVAAYTPSTDLSKYAGKEPLIKFEDPKPSVLSQGSLLKQLLNIKKMYASS